MLAEQSLNVRTEVNRCSAHQKDHNFTKLWAYDLFLKGWKEVTGIPISQRSREEWCPRLFTNITTEPENGFKSRFSPQGTSKVLFSSESSRSCFRLCSFRTWISQLFSIDSVNEIQYLLCAHFTSDIWKIGCQFWAVDTQALWGGIMSFLYKVFNYELLLFIFMLLNPNVLALLHIQSCFGEQKTLSLEQCQKLFADIDTIAEVDLIACLCMEWILCEHESCEERIQLSK